MRKVVCEYAPSFTGLAEEGQALPQGLVLAEQVIRQVHAVPSYPIHGSIPGAALTGGLGRFPGAIMEQFSKYDKK